MFQKPAPAGFSVLQRLSLEPAASPIPAARNPICKVTRVQRRGALHIDNLSEVP